MKRITYPFMCISFALFSSLQASATEEVSPAVQNLVPVLSKLSTNPVLIAAVKSQNSQGLSLDEIKKRDKEWIATTGINATMKALMENEAAKELATMESTETFYFESFLMDNQGANVAMTNKTSDYWQGDESKFTESFKQSNALYFGPIEFDDSAQAYLIQVSIPIRSDNNTIGVLTVGVNIDELESGL